MTTGFWEQYLLPCRLADCEFPIVNLDDMEKLGVVAHEYPFRPGADLEHMGRGAARFRIVGAFFRKLDGYTSALYPGTYETLRARLRQNPITTLVHPTMGFLEVGVEQMDAARDTEKRDGEFLTLTIVESGHASDVGTGVGVAPQDIEAALLAHAVVVPTIPDDPPLNFLDRVRALLADARAINNTVQNAARDARADVDHYSTGAVELSQRIEAFVEEVRGARDQAFSLASGDKFRGCSLLLDDLALWRRDLMGDGLESIVYDVRSATDLWRLSQDLYGNPDQVAVIQAMNPALSTVFLAAGTRLTLPPPPAYGRGLP